MRAEKLKDPDYYIGFMLEKANKNEIKKIYGIEDWKDTEDFLKKTAIKFGRLLK